MKIFSVLSFGLCLTFAMGQDVVNEVGKKTIKTNTKAAVKKKSQGSVFYSNIYSVTLYQ